MTNLKFLIINEIQSLNLQPRIESEIINLIKSLEESELVKFISDSKNLKLWQEHILEQHAANTMSPDQKAELIKTLRNAAIGGGAKVVAGKIVAATGMLTGGGAIPIIGAGIFAATLGFAAVRTYEKITAQSDERCIQPKIEERRKCIKQYQIRGYQQAMADLKSAESVCPKTKNPKKCIKIINKKIEKIGKKLTKLQQKG